VEGVRIASIMAMEQRRLGGDQSVDENGRLLDSLWLPVGRHRVLRCGAIHRPERPRGDRHQKVGVIDAI
jgi:hypothetical protein